MHILGDEMSFLVKFKRGLATLTTTFTLALGLASVTATDAQAVGIPHLAYANASGSFMLDNNTVDETFALGLGGTFSAGFDPLQMSGVTASTVLEVTGSLDITSPFGPMSFSDSTLITAGALAGLLNNILSNSVVSGLISHILSNDPAGYPLLGGTLTSNYSNVVTGPTDITGDFTLGYAHNQTALPGLPTILVPGNFSAALTIDVVPPAVPLPATLPLMLAGFGGLVALRRKRG